MKRWTTTWARQLATRFLQDPDYRSGVVRRALILAATGAIRPDLGGGVIGGSDRGLVGRWLARRRRPMRGLVSPMGDVTPLSDYQAHVAANRFTAAARRDLEVALALRADRLPRISVLTPLYNTPPDLLEALIHSVQSQVYTDFEWRLVDDASTRDAHLERFAAVTGSDSRFHLVRSPENGGISRATNLAASSAQGEVLIFVDHDDLITPDCLAEIALYYADHCDADLVYSDDDKMAPDGERFAPQFKPDYSPVFLMSHMYMGHVLSVRKRLFDAVGGFRPQFDGSQDFDFVLRASEQARHVGHVPRVLYHWRVTPESTASSGSAKPESFERGQQAVQEALDRRGAAGARAIHPDEARLAGCGLFKLAFPHSGPRVCVIIPTHNGAALLTHCLASLKATLYDNFEVMIVDNDSDDPATLSLLAEAATWPNVRVERISNNGGPFSFARVNNEAVRRASTPFVLLLNDDTQVLSANWLSQMMGYGQMQGVGTVGAKLLFEDRTLQHAGIVHGYYGGMAGPAFRGLPHDAWGDLNRIISAHEASAVTAACLLMSRDVFLELGGFDERRFAVAYNDVDLCYRVAARGLSNIYCADAVLFHYEGKTRGHRDNPREIAAFKALYGRKRDPYYNPNLSLENERFGVRGARLPARSRRPVRTAVVTHNLEHEGATNSMFELVTGLRDRGVIDPVVYSTVDGPLRHSYAAARLDVHMISHPLSGVHTPADFVANRDQLAGVFAAANVEAVYANTLQTFWALSAAEAAGLPAIWNPRESDPCETYYDFLAPRLRPTAYRAFHSAYAVVFVSGATRRHWRRFETRNNFHLIPNGISLDRLTARGRSRNRESARMALDLKPDERAIVLVGTVCERKGQMDLVEAVALLDPACRCRVFIVGDREGPYSRRLHAAIAASPPQVRARIHVIAETDDACLYFQAADIAVCASRIESYPRVILEAMAYGLPIITTPVFGIPEQVREDENAIFYSPGDAATLARALRRLMEAPDMARRMGDASPIVLQGLMSYDDMLDAYGDIFRQAILSREGI